MIVTVDGKALRAARLSRGFTQSELADLAGVGRAHVSLIENGRSGVSIGKAATIAEMLGVSLDSILTRGGAR